MKLRLAVLTKNLTNPAYGAARRGADRVAAERGAVVTHYVPAVPDDVGQQLGLIREAIDARPDAIVLVPVHETAVNAGIEAIAAARIPLFTFVTPVTAGAPITFVGSDDRALGAALARRLFAELKRSGRIVIIEGTPASATSRHRTEGFHDALREHPGVTIAASIVGSYQRADASAAFAALPIETRRVDGILCANDVMALGVLDVLDVLDRDARCVPGSLPLIVGVNALPEAIAEIARGRLLATADFDAMSMCALATEAALRHLGGERVPDKILLPAEIVDACNCHHWNAPFETRVSKPWHQLAGPGRAT